MDIFVELFSKLTKITRCVLLKNPSTQLHIPRSLPHEMFLQFPVTHAVIQNGGLSHDGPTEV